MPVFPKSINTEVRQPRGYAHRVERQKIIEGLGLEVVVGAFKTGLREKTSLWL